MKAIVWCLVCAIVLCGRAVAGVVDLDIAADHRGWYAKSVDDRFARTNDEPGLQFNNYFTGRLYISSAGVFFDYRSFFVWDLAAVDREVADVTFVVSFGEYLGADPTENVELRSFSGSVNDLVTGTGDPFDMFSELGTGADSYASYLGSPDDEETTISIPLSPAAIGAINEARGTGVFVMGGMLTTIGDMAEQAVFSSTAGDEYQTRLQITYIPGPGSLGIALSVASLGLAKRRRRW